MSDLKNKTVLTGVKPTHLPHIGNYLGAMLPAIQLTQQAGRSLLFIADYHALTTVHDKELLKEWTYGVAACWLACGLDPQKTIIYRQSDIPEIFEISWILSCFTAKGLMNRAHAYKAVVADNEEKGKKDLDDGVSMGLFTYPVLMSADIISFDTDIVPVGQDQIQHVEYARDIAQRMNTIYKNDFVKLPAAKISEDTKLVPGLDGRKMSKSYGNHIPLFMESKKLRKLVMKIKTDSSAPEDPKDPDDSLLFDLYKEFAKPDQIESMRKQYQEGIGWGHVKQALFEVIEEHFSQAKAKYDHLMANREELEEILQDGAKRAREISGPVLQRLKEQTGVK